MKAGQEAEQVGQCGLLLRVRSEISTASRPSTRSTRCSTWARPVGVRVTSTVRVPSGPGVRSTRPSRSAWAMRGEMAPAVTGGRARSAGYHGQCGVSRGTSPTPKFFRDALTGKRASAAGGWSRRRCAGQSSKGFAAPASVSMVQASAASAPVTIRSSWGGRRRQRGHGYLGSRHLRLCQFSPPVARVIGNPRVGDDAL